MIIAQLTDLHIGFDGSDKPCSNTPRLLAALSQIADMKRGPDLMILSGDLVEHGEHWAYAQLKDAIHGLNIPVYFAMGNHDDRAAFQGDFPHIEFNDGFLQYTIENGPLRVIVLDSLKDGFHGGAFCPRRADWLRARLSEQPERPTLLVLHHPPIKTGIGWMTANEEAGWARRLRGVVDDFENVVQIICGHIHRPILRAFGKTMVSVAPAIAPQLTLDLAPIKPDAPDGRVLLDHADPAYCLHHFDDGKLTTHFCTAPSAEPLVRYDEDHAFIIRHTLDLDKRK